MQIIPHSLFQHIKHDIRTGLLAYWKQYSVVLAIFILLCAKLFFAHKSSLFLVGMDSTVKIEPNLSFGDYLFDIFKGMKVFDPTDETFVVNAFWVFINLCLALLVSFYPFKDLRGYGQLMLLRSQKRVYWWISKCLWNIASVAVFYFIIYVTAFIWSLISGNVSILPQIGNQSFLNKANTENITVQTMILYSIMLTFFISIAISLLQMTVSLLTKPIFGIIVVACILASAIFYCSPWLPGNYLMLMRVDDVNPGFGISFISGIITAIVISLISIIGGVLLIRKRDLL